MTSARPACRHRGRWRPLLVSRGGHGTHARDPVERLLTLNKLLQDLSATRYQPIDPGTPLKGPATQLVIQPP